MNPLAWWLIAAAAVSAAYWLGGWSGYRVGYDDGWRKAKEANRSFGPSLSSPSEYDLADYD